MDKTLKLRKKLLNALKSDITIEWQKEFSIHKKIWSSYVGGAQILNDIALQNHLNTSWLDYFLELYKPQEVFLSLSTKKLNALEEREEKDALALREIMLSVIGQHNSYALIHIWNWLENSESEDASANSKKVQKLLNRCVAPQGYQSIQLQNFTQHCVLSGFIEGIKFFKDKEKNALEQLSYLQLTQEHMADSLKLSLIKSQNFITTQYVLGHLNFKVLKRHINAELKHTQNWRELLLQRYCHHTEAEQATFLVGRALASIEPRAQEAKQVSMRQVIKAFLHTLECRHSYFFHEGIFSAFLANNSLSPQHIKQIARFYKNKVFIVFQQAIKLSKHESFDLAQGFFSCFKHLLEQGVYSNKEIQKLQIICQKALSKMPNQTQLQHLQIMLTQKELYQIIEPTSFVICPTKTHKI